MTHNPPSPTLLQALTPIAFLVFFLVLNVLNWGDDTLSGANQMALLLASAVAGLVVTWLGVPWKRVMGAVVKTIGTAMPAILILLLIGALAGTWLLSGVVPAMVYYGLDILHPRIFLVASVIITGVVSLATGSSWSTIATIGVALMGIGNALGFHEGLTAGAIVSGAYFGDKISPLSDTTNLASAMAGTTLFVHIRYMLYTTVPTMLITLVIFTVIGLRHEGAEALGMVDQVKAAIGEAFVINGWLFLVPVILILIIVKQVPPTPALLAGALLGGLFAVVFQPQVVEQVAGEGFGYAQSSYRAVMQAMFGPISIGSGNAAVDELFSTGGMAGMLNTIWLILSAMVFGGVMESGRLLARLTQVIMQAAKSTASMVASTVGTCVFFNVTASDQYISIVVPGRMFAKTYREKGLKPEVLSRTLEDAGTVTSVLVPWNTCGATQATVLGVPTIAYLPYAFFNLISPFMSILVAALDYKIRRYTPEELAELEDENKI